MTQSIFDAQHFMQTLGNDEELAQELLAAFLEDSEKRTNALKAALDEGDAPTASKLAHSLKGMCGVVRAEDLVSTAYNMENSAKAGNLDQTREQFAKFVAMLEKGYVEMKAFLD